MDSLPPSPKTSIPIFEGLCSKSCLPNKSLASLEAPLSFAELVFWFAFCKKVLQIATGSLRRAYYLSNSVVAIVINKTVVAYQLYGLYISSGVTFFYKLKRCVKFTHVGHFQLIQKQQN